MRSEAIALALTALLAATGALALDFDGDGLVTVQEWGSRTSVLDVDSDDDGLSDRLEREIGTSPRQADTDGDGLPDGQERVLGLDPRNRDMDGDGVFDGQEGATVCTLRRDCDGDGLDDGDEIEFDPLNPDTFDTGISDGITRSFQDAGQPPGADADLDGIPDGWEESQGIIDWGPFTPRAGQRDLLVEYLMVTGPSSGRYNLDFRPAYDAVATMFSQAGIQLQWVETRVPLPAEHRPGFLDEDEVGHYRTILEAGVASTNPYVTSIVLNPQQVQTDLGGKVLGAAFLRSMIATVDYGAHVSIRFVEQDSDGIVLTGDGFLDLQPVLESHILGARAEQLNQIAFAQEGIVDLGRMANGVYMVTRQGGSDFTWTWQNDWFVTAPRITSEDGSYLQTRATTATVDQATLAQTIAHELGHTLGLCHAHEESCYQAFHRGELNRAAIDSTSMSYTAPGGTLHFLETEWSQVGDYLTCPPEAPIRLLAEQASIEAFYDAKYETSFMSAIEVRSCGQSAAIVADLQAQPLVAQGATGLGWLLAYVATTLAAAGIALTRLPART